MNTHKMTTQQAQKSYWNSEYQEYDTWDQCPKCNHWHRAEVLTKTVYDKITYGGIEALFPRKVIISEPCPACVNPKRGAKLDIGD